MSISVPANVIATHTATATDPKAPISLPTAASSATTTSKTSTPATPTAVAPTEDAPLPDTLTSGAVTAASGSEGGLKDQFLRLLVAQIQFQDPLAPQDGTAYIAQLATLAQVEQTEEMNTRLGDLQDAQASNLRAGYANLVGRTVEAKTDAIHAPVGDVTLVIDLANPPATASVEILDSDGNVVRTLSKEGLSKHFEVAWDGRDDKGNPVADGDYTVRVKASDSKGAAIDAETILRGAVTAVSYADGAVQLLIGSTPVVPGAITNIAR